MEVKVPRDPGAERTNRSKRLVALSVAAGIIVFVVLLLFTYARAH